MNTASSSNVLHVQRSRRVPDAADTTISPQVKEALVTMERFGALAAKSSEYQTLIKAARESFVLIEPWANASSERKVVQGILTSMRNEAKTFFGAVGMSLKNAQSGYSFAFEASRLCDWLLEPIETHTSEVIRANIKAMQEIAEKAHYEVEVTAEKFRANRRGFSAITGQIPDALQGVKSEQALIVASRDSAKRRSESWGWPFSTNSKGKSKVSRNFLKVAAALIVLPVALPVALAAEAQVKERDQQLIHFGDGVKQLEGAVIALNGLMENLDVLAAYWLKMNAVLEDIHSRVDDLRNDILLQLKIKDLKKDWEQVGGQFLAYKTELAKMTDYSNAATTLGPGCQQTTRRIK